MTASVCVDEAAGRRIKADVLERDAGGDQHGGQRLLRRGGQMASALLSDGDPARHDDRHEVPVRVQRVARTRRRRRRRRTRHRRRVGGMRGHFLKTRVVL